MSARTNNSFQKLAQLPVWWSTIMRLIAALPAVWPRVHNNQPFNIRYAGIPQSAALTAD